MTRLLLATRLLLPRRAWLIGYWLTVTSFLALVTIGLKDASNSTATLWGLQLVGFGSTSTQIMCSAFLEMASHAWTLMALPFVCFIGVQPLIRSFRVDFRLFLRFGRSSCLFIEGARSLALLGVMVAVSLPFAAAMVWGHIWPGLEWPEVLGGLTSCIATTLFVGALAYALASFGVPREIVVSLAMITPFLSEGVSTFLEKNDRLFLLNWMPPGLPYDIRSANDPALRVALVVFLVIVGGRLVCAGRTRWLLSD